MYLKIFTVIFLLGLYPILLKFALNHISGATFMFGFSICYFINELIYSAYHYNTVKKEISILNKNIFIYGIFILTAIVVSFINYLTYELIKTHKVYYITTILSVYPIVTTILSYFLFKENINIFSFIGVIFVITGVMIIKFSSTLE